MTLPDRKFIRKHEIDAVFAAIDKGSRHPARDRMLVLLSASLGLRVTEAVNMKKQNFRDVGKGWVYVCSAKKRKGWVVCTPEEAEDRRKAGYQVINKKMLCYKANERPEERLPIVPEIGEEVRAYIKTIKTDHLFPGRVNGHMGERQAFELFSKYCVSAGIGHKSFHALRHYRGFMVQAAKGDIDWTRRMLRHSNTSMTQIYTERTPDEEKKLASEIGW